MYHEFHTSYGQLPTESNEECIIRSLNTVATDLFKPLALIRRMINDYWQKHAFREIARKKVPEGKIRGRQFGPF